MIVIVYIDVLIFSYYYYSFKGDKYAAYTHLAKFDFFFLMMCPYVDVHIIFLHYIHIYFFLVLCPHTTIKQPTSTRTSLF